MGKPIDVTDATFPDEVLQSDKPVLVDFWAVWCGPCRMLGPILSEIAEEDDRIKIAKVNIDDEAEYASQLGVVNIPTMVLFKEGKPVDKLVGALPKRAIQDRLETHLS